MPLDYVTYLLITITMLLSYSPTFSALEMTTISGQISVEIIMVAPELPPTFFDVYNYISKHKRYNNSIRKLSVRPIVQTGIYLLSEFHISSLS